MGRRGNTMSLPTITKTLEGMAMVPILTHAAYNNVAALSEWMRSASLGQAVESLEESEDVPIGKLLAALMMRLESGTMKSMGLRMWDENKSEIRSGRDFLRIFSNNLHARSLSLQEAREKLTCLRQLGEEDAAMFSQRVQEVSQSIQKLCLLF